MKLGIDCDGVFCNFSLRFSELLRERFGTHIPLITDKEQIKDWDWFNWVDISKEEYALAWQVVHETHNFWESLEPLNKDEISYLNTFLVDDPTTDIYFITTRANTRGDSVVNQTVNWFKKHGFKGHPQVIVTKEKGKVCNALGVEYFIDDSGKNCIDVAVKNPECKVFLMDYPHNRKEVYNQYNNINRVDSIYEFVDRVVKNIK